MEFACETSSAARHAQQQESAIAARPIADRNPNGDPQRSWTTGLTDFFSAAGRRGRLLCAIATSVRRIRERTCAKPGAGNQGERRNTVSTQCPRNLYRWTRPTPSRRSSFRRVSAERRRRRLHRRAPQPAPVRPGAVSRQSIDPLHRRVCTNQGQVRYPGAFFASGRRRSMLEVKNEIGILDRTPTGAARTAGPVIEVPRAAWARPGGRQGIKYATASATSLPTGSSPARNRRSCAMTTKRPGGNPDPGR